MKHVAALKRLEWVNLSYTQVGDEGVKHLLALKHLRGLILQNTGVSADAVKKLQQSLPDLNILYSNRRTRGRAGPRR
jgi:hypothetical protein